MMKKIEDWQVVGYLPAGERVYCSVNGEHAKEIDYEYLVELTAQELCSVMSERK